MTLQPKWERDDVVKQRWGYTLLDQFRVFNFEFSRFHFVAPDTVFLIHHVSNRRSVLGSLSSAQELDVTPDAKLWREKGSDMAKKESVAKTRYMDKQKVASF